MAGSSQGERLARVHTNASNRRKARETVEKKEVLKYALDNPFHISWPNVPLNVQNAVLARFIELVQGVAEYNISRRAVRGKRVRGKEKHSGGEPEESNKKRRLSPGVISSANEASASASASTSNTIDDQKIEDDTIDIGNTANEDSKMLDKTDTRATPSCLSNLTIGINAVTRKLELQSRPPQRTFSTLKSASIDNNDENSSNTRVNLILVCKADISPALLVAHLPQLIAACNSYEPAHPVKLVPLPKNSEGSIAEALGLRRAAVVALDEKLSSDPTLTSLLESVPSLAAPWAVSLSLSVPPKTRSEQTRELIPTHIKQLRTTAPKDMRAAKEQRAKARADAKRKKKDTKKEIAEEGKGGETEETKTNGLVDTLADPWGYAFQPMGVYRGRN